MTPWRSRESREPSAHTAGRDLELDTIEAALNADPTGSDIAFYYFISADVESDLSEASLQRLIEERVRIQRALALEPIVIRDDIPPRAASGKAAFSMERFRAKLELEEQGIRVPYLIGLRRYPRRAARRSSSATPLDPDEFMQRFVDTLGTHAAKVLVMHACDVVEATGELDRWISEVRRAWERAAISSAVGHFLIWQFAESAVIHYAVRNPTLCRLAAKIERLEREHEIEENTDLSHGPPEWAALYEIWNGAYHVVMTHILLRNHEREILDRYFAHDAQFGEGRREILGV